MSRNVASCIYNIYRVSYHYTAVLIKMIFHNSQYLMVYKCVGPVQPNGVCVPQNEEIQIWAHHYVSNLFNSKMLIDVAAERTCVDVSNMVQVTRNGK